MTVCELVELTEYNLHSQAQHTKDTAGIRGSLMPVCELFKTFRKVWRRVRGSRLGSSDERRMREKPDLHRTMVVSQGSGWTWYL